MKPTSLLAALSISTMLTGGMAAAADLDKVTVVLGYVVDAESYGAIYAKEAGIFEAEGLDVTIIPAGAGVDQVQMVASGLATIGIVSPEPILAGIDKGEDFKIFAAQFQRTPVAMTCRRDSGVTQPSELEGKRLGVKTSGTAMADLFLAKNDIDKSKVEVTSIGPSDIALIVAGRIDCMLTTFAFNEPRMIEDLGVPVNVISLGDYGMNSQTNSYFVRSDFYDAEGSKDILTRYLRAEGKAWEEFYKDPAAGAKFIVEGEGGDGLDLGQQVYQSEKQVEYMSSPLTKEKGLMWIDAAVWPETTQNAFEAGLTQAPVDLSDVLTFEILDAAQPPKL